MAEREELLLDVVVEGFRQFNTRMDQMDQRIDGVSSRWNGLSSIVSGGVAVALGNLATGTLRFATQALERMAVALRSVLTESIDLASDFQSQMAILAIAARDSGKSMEELSDIAIAVGGDTRLLGVSATGAADAMTGLYKAGLSTTEIFGDVNAFMDEGAELGGALRASIDLAAASELDMVQASELAAVMLATFGGELGTAEERAEFVNFALNNIVQTADASVAEVSDLAAAMGNIGTVANRMGLGIEDVNIALGIMSTRGIRGAEAGTGLRSMLQNMQRPTAAVNNAWQALGTSMYDAEGNMRELPDIIADINRGLETMTQEQRDVTLTQLASSYGVNALTALLDEGAVGWSDMAREVGNAATIQDISAARAATYAGQMEALQGVLETLKISIGTAFLPALTEIGKTFAQLIDTHGPAITAFFENVGRAISGLWALVVGGDFTAALGEAFGIHEDNPLVTGFLTIRDILLGLLSGDVTIADLLPEEVVTILDSFNLALATLSDWWNEYGPTITEMAQTLFTTLIENGMELRDNVVPFIVERLAEFSAWWTANGPLITEWLGVFSERWGAISTVVTDFWMVVEPILTGFWQLILNLVTFILEVATGDWTGAWEALKEVFVGVWDSIKEIFVGLADFIGTFFGTTWQETTETWRQNWETFKEIVDELWSRLKEAVGDKLTEIVDTILGVRDRMIEAGGNIIDGLKEGVTSAAQGLIDAVSGVVNSAIDAARSVLGIESPSKVFAGMGVNIARSFADAVSSMTPMVNAQVAAMVSPVPAMASVGGGTTYIDRSTNRREVNAPVTIQASSQLDLDAAANYLQQRISEDINND